MGVPTSAVSHELIAAVVEAAHARLGRTDFQRAVAGSALGMEVRANPDAPDLVAGAISRLLGNEKDVAEGLSALHCLTAFDAGDGDLARDAAVRLAAKSGVMTPDVIAAIANETARLLERANCIHQSGDSQVVVDPLKGPNTEPATPQTLLSVLDEIAAERRAPETPPWDFEVIRRKMAPPENTFNWPDADGFVKRSEAALALVSAAADSPDPDKCFWTAKQRLEETKRVAAGLEVLSVEADTIARDLNAVAIAYLKSIPGTDNAHAEALLAINCGDVEQAARVVLDIAKKNRAHWEETNHGLFDLVAAVEKEAARLEPGLNRRVFESVRDSLLRRDTEQLARLLTQAQELSAKESKAADKRRKAAMAALAVLRKEAAVAVPEDVGLACLQLVNAGNAFMAGKVISTYVESLTQEEQKPSLPIPAPSPRVYELKGFKARNRSTAQYIEKKKKLAVADIAGLLERRAIEEMRRGSLLGIVDHALDMLKLAALQPLVPDESRLWAERGLALIAAAPPAHQCSAGWGKTLADRVQSSLDQPNAFGTWMERLILSPGFDVAISERFTQKEIEPYNARLAAELLRVARTQSEDLVEDVFSAIACGLTYGDRGTVQGLLAAMATAYGATAESVGELSEALVSVDHAPARIPARISGPPILFEAVAAYRSALLGIRDMATRTPTRAAHEVNVQVPPSVQSSGGFRYVPGSRCVDAALLVSSPQGKIFSGCDLIISVERNTPWLVADTACVLGPLDKEARLLAATRLELADDPPEKLTIGFELRYRDAQSGETKFFDGRLQDVKLRTAGGLKIHDYAGADGKPMTLSGINLQLASDSVKMALRKILNRLASGNAAALILGRRRRGKTSILTTLKADPEVMKKYIIKYDILDDLPFTELRQALGRLGSHLDAAARRWNVKVESLEKIWLAHPEKGSKAAQDWLDQASRELIQPTRVLLLIDEFQKWLSEMNDSDRLQLLMVLRTLINRPAAETLSISLVLSGLNTIRNHIAASADFQNAFEVYEVKPFKAQEAESLIRSNASIEFDTRAVSRIRRLTGGNPYLINLLGNDIAGLLRDEGRAYCFPEDVERIVKAQLEADANSRVWHFLQYLLRQGEEDHSPVIKELPAIAAVAATLRNRGARRKGVSPQEVAQTLSQQNIECDLDALHEHLSTAVQNELLVREGQRYSFAADWMAEWLAAIYEREPRAVVATTDPDLVLNKYKLVRQIATGGQSSVFSAYEDRGAIKREVVLKIYPRPSQAESSSIIQREVKALFALQHPGIIKCYDYGQDSHKGDVVVLEPVTGHTLRLLLRERPKSATELIGCEGALTAQVQLLLQLATALCACHRAGVVHKDLKPENIMVDQSSGLWMTKIIDFGIATQLDAVQPSVPSGASFTPGYVAPERYEGRQRKAPADVYSLGVTAYELLTGQAPFPTEMAAAMKAQQTSQFTPIQELRPKLPRRLAELIENMMARSPEDRPNIFTVAGSLLPALEEDDWRALKAIGEDEYLASNYKAAFDPLEKAAMCAGRLDRATQDYLDLLGTLMASAKACGTFFRIAPKLAEPVFQASAASEHWTARATDYVDLLATEPLNAGEQEEQDTAAALFFELLNDNIAHNGLAEAVTHLLSRPDDPVVWRAREMLFLVGCRYREFLAPGTVENWCVRCATRCRQTALSVTEALVWLSRAERLGAQSSPRFREERLELDRVMKKSANAVELPAIAKSQAKPVVGSDERPHLNVDKIERWTERLLRLYPCVQEVRRVRKESGIPLQPTRILDLRHLATHAKLTPGIDEKRIIPAVLDESFCLPPGTTVLRINIVLPEGTTLSQREAVIELLRANTRIFGEEY